MLTSHMSPFLFRPWLLSRHLALVSQTHSLSLLLSRANPAALHGQLARFDEALLEDARQHNKFSAPEVADQTGAGVGGSSVYGGAGDALFGGRAGEDGAKGESSTHSGVKLPRVQYSDGDANPLRRIAPHPFHPLDATKAQTVIPSLLLPRGIDNQVNDEMDARWEAWLRKNSDYLGISAAADAAAGSSNGDALLHTVAAISPEEKRRWIKHAREQAYAHDAFATQALRSWIHAREATDELGQRYDWHMRLDSAEDSDEGEDEGENGIDEVEDGGDDPEADASDAIMVDALGMPLAGGAPGDARKRKREQDSDAHREQKDCPEEPPLSLEQVTRFLQTGVA